MTVRRFEQQRLRALKKERQWERRRRQSWVKRVGSPMAHLRLHELKVIFTDRYGVTLPDDDAGRDDLALLFHHAANTGGDVIEKMVGHAGKWAPWLPPTEAKRLARQIAARPTRFDADGLARRVGLKYHDRTRLKIRTIGCSDMTADQRRWFKKEADALRKQKKRREQGVRSRAEYEAKSLTRLKPWAAEGISRSAWERRRGKRRKSDRHIAKVVTADRLDASTEVFSAMVTLSPPPSQKGGGAKPFGQHGVPIKMFFPAYSGHGGCIEAEAPEGIRTARDFR